MFNSDDLILSETKVRKPSIVLATFLRIRLSEPLSNKTRRDEDSSRKKDTSHRIENNFCPTANNRATAKFQQFLGSCSRTRESIQTQRQQDISVSGLLLAFARGRLLPRRAYVSCTCFGGGGVAGRGIVRGTAIQTRKLPNIFNIS